MYQVKITLPKPSATLLILKTEERINARYAKALCLENELECEVVEERQPRQVKFKNL